MGIPNVWRKRQVMTYYNFLYAAPPSNLRGNPLIRRIISAVCPQNQFIEGLVPSFHIIKKKKKIKCFQNCGKFSNNHLFKNIRKLSVLVYFCKTQNRDANIITSLVYFIIIN